MATLPMKFRIIHYIAHNDNCTDQEILDAIKADYAGEGQASMKGVDQHTSSLKAVGMIENSSVELSGSGELIQKYVITDYGKSTMKYLPAEWRD